MKIEIIFHLGEPFCRIRAIKFVHVNSWRVEVSQKVVSMRTLLMGRVLTILIRWFFRRGRVLGMTHEVFKGGFEVFDVGKLVLEGLNRIID
jgi:hypothetical protein